MSKSKQFLVAMLAIALLAGLTISTRSSSAQPDLVQGLSKLLKVENAVADQYIVVLHDSAAGPRGEHSLAPTLAALLTGIYGGEVNHIYRHSLHGFSVRMPEAAARLLSLDPRVAYVEEDSLVTLLGDAIQSDLGTGSNRPARSPAVGFIYLQRDRSRR